MLFKGGIEVSFFENGRYAIGISDKLALTRIPRSQFGNVDHLSSNNN